MSDRTRMTAEAGAGPSPIRISRFQVAVVTLMAVAGIVLYPSIPGRIPQHWTAAGQIDRWAGKSVFSVFMPVFISAALVLLAWVLPRIDPLKASYRRFTSTYYMVFDIIIGFMAFIYAATLYAAFHPAVQMSVLIPVGVGLLLAVLGNQMGKVKRNFFMGIRTPWTLASERVWTETHRIGGRIFVVCGILMALCALLVPARYEAPVFIALVLVLTLGTTGLSYVIYKRLEREGRLDNDLQPPSPA